jgi:trans-aconitate methyltransferase
MANRRNAAAKRHAAVRTDFDEAYYRRFYVDRRTRAQDPREVRRLAAFVFAYLEYLRVPVRRVLDLGCGFGRWRDALAAHHPRATYTGVESSEYLCEKFGWERGGVAEYRGRGQYDLVICQGVLQYVDEAGVHRAMANLARLCRGALYLEIATRGDLQKNTDRTATDANVYARSADWYRRIIERHFRGIGGGVFLPKDSPVVLYELETPERAR